MPQSIQRLLARGKPPGRALLIWLSGLWDAALTESLGGGLAAPSGLWAYAKAGPDPARQPRALFDQAAYLQQRPALAQSRWPPLAHYLIEGDALGLSPHPLIDLALADRASRRTALHGFLAVGAPAGANPHPLFDTRFYVERCEAVSQSGENPLIHYLRVGWREGLDPHPLFANDWYLAANPQARAAGIAPLLHYVTQGADQGLAPHPLAGGLGFHPAYYLHRAGAAAQADPLLHYLTTGAFEGLWPAPDFDEAGYFAVYPEAIESPLAALDHWARNGTARPDVKVVGPPQGASAQALYEHYSQAAWPEAPDAEVEAYAAARAALGDLHRVGADLDHPPRLFALRTLREPDWRRVVAEGRLPTGGLHDPADPAVLARDERLAARYGITLIHEVAGPQDAALLTGLSQPYALEWIGGDGDRECLAPLLASPLCVKIGDPPLRLVPANDRPGVFQAQLEAALAANAGPVVIDGWNHWEAGRVIAPDLRFGHGWLEAAANAQDADLLAP